MGSLKPALRLLTVIPVPGWLPDEPGRPAGRSTVWFPAVGALIGGVVCVPLLAPVPRTVAAATALLGWVAVTGALHEDALMDVSDALPLHGDRERRLEVLADPRVGGFGVTAVVTVLLLRFTLLAEGNPAAALASPVVGRWAMAVSLARAPALRSEGLGASFREGARPVAASLAAALLLAGVVPVAAWITASTGGAAASPLGPSLLAELGRVGGAWLLGAAAAWGFATLAVRRLGGLNGDCHGAAGYLAETAALLPFLPVA